MDIPDLLFDRKKMVHQTFWSGRPTFLGIFQINQAASLYIFEEKETMQQILTRQFNLFLCRKTLRLYQVLVVTESSPSGAA